MFDGFILLSMGLPVLGQATFLCLSVIFIIPPERRRCEDLYFEHLINGDT